MLISIPTYTNTVGLTALLVNLQPQLKTTDLIHICDTHPDKLSLPVIQMYGSSRCPIIVDCQPRSIYEAWNDGIGFMKENSQEGILILNDDVLLPMTAIDSFRKSAKDPSWDCLVPHTPDRAWTSKKLDGNFQWYSSSTIKIEKTNWMCGFAFYLPAKTIERVGLFDTQFDIWFGDTDFEKRLKNIGVITNEYVYHFGGSSYEYKTEAVKARIRLDKQKFNKKHPL